MANVWPATLPAYVEQDSFKEKKSPNSIRTKFEAGNVKSRRRFTASIKIFTVSISCSAQQKTYLDEFFADTCEDGSLPFEWVLPASQITANFVFMSEPEWSAVGPTQFRAQFDLQTVPG